MQLIYGGYSHVVNSVGFRHYKRTIHDRFHRGIGNVQTWHIAGTLQASTQAALTVLIDALEAAYGTDNQDLTFKDNTPANTSHVIDSSATFSGTNVAHLGYPKGGWDMQTEYGSGSANKRTFEIIVTADTRIGSASTLYAFREKVTRIGTGGPLNKYMGSLTGVPVLQTLRLRTPVRYIQEGYVIGRGQYLIPPPALTALGIERGELRMLQNVSPEEIRNNGTAQKSELFRTNYRYVLENTFVGAPMPSVVTI